MLCYVMLFCSILSKINIMNEWMQKVWTKQKPLFSRFRESEYRHDSEKSADEMGSSDYIRTQIIIYERTDQSLCQRSKLLILNWTRRMNWRNLIVSVSIHDVVDLPVLKRRKSKRMIRSYNSASCGDQLLLLCFVFYEWSAEKVNNCGD